MKKTYSIIIIVLTLILTAINVWLFAERSQDDCKTTCIVAKESGCYLTKTLSLTDNQKETFEKFDDCWSEYMSLAEAAIFEYAFKLGARLTLEIQQDN